MPVCEECSKFFTLEDDRKRGDCVQRVTDARQAYYKARPVAANRDAAGCSEFKKRKPVSQ